MKNAKKKELNHSQHLQPENRTTKHQKIGDLTAQKANFT